ncbi:hypothetical protein KAZ66_00170 [Candidatus Woesebacteria bacterium]|nr:hypothetical protein [Candidatus Woesebacteria bacterium]
MSKQSEAIKQWRKNTKQKVIIAMGNSCQVCNYNKCNDALELHHLDPSEKEFGLGAIMAHPVRWDKIVDEIKKCILLCSNCHREVHKGITIIPENYQRFDESLLLTKEAEEIIQIKAPKEITYCPICNIEKSHFNKYCSYTCAAKSQKHTKFNWGDIDIVDLIENHQMSKTKIAEQLGCSEAAVRKRYLKLKSAL